MTLMLRLPPDKYRFRQVLINVLHLPCIGVWLYVLIFSVTPFWLAFVLACLLGIGSACFIGATLALIGHGVISAFGSRDHERRSR